MVDLDRLSAAYETARCDLLAECEPSGHWIGRLASSPLSTATAISALAILDGHAPTNSAGRFADEHREEHLSRLIVRSLRWLARHQNADGGWGDTDKSLSNIATTMLVRAAFQLTGVPAANDDLLQRADQYIAANGGVAGLRRRYGKDKTFAAPILANCALAGLISWREVPALPFELACLPQRTWASLRLPVVSYAVPALVAIGQARYAHRKPWNPLVRLIRRAAVAPSLRVLERQQPASGGFLEAIPLTSFVVMSLAAIGCVDHSAVRRGAEFILALARPDGSWPIDSNLATWNTSLALNALGAAGEPHVDPHGLDWLLACQHRHPHPFTGAQPGGWAWTDLSGGVPDADDTSAALLALKLSLPQLSGVKRDQALASASSAVKWLLDLQNADGGWPTFCRGWGKLPFDRSGSDLTAHALRALQGWRNVLARQLTVSDDVRRLLDQQIGNALEQGLRFLAARQDPSGSWEPLWFGDQYDPGENNLVYGTARVLLALRDLARLDMAMARRGLDWLAAQQRSDGGWGGPRATGELGVSEPYSSVEQTAVAVEALLSCGPAGAHQAAAMKGLSWLVDAVEANRHQECSPIGFYFAKLWYYEKLYPLIFTVAALGQAVRRFLPRPAPQTSLPLGNA